MSKQTPPPDEANKMVEELNEKIVKLDRKLFNFFTLLQAGKAFDNMLEAQKLYNVFTSIVQERFGLEAFALFIRDPQENAFQLVRGFGLDEAMPVDYSFPCQEGLLWQAILQDKPFSIVDSRGEPRFRIPHESFRFDYLRSRLFVPMLHQRDVIGLLSVGDKMDGREFTDDDLEFINILAEQAAVSINTTMLYEKNERDRKELDKTVKSLSILHDIGRALIHIQDLKNLLQFILGQAIETTEAQKGSLMLWEPTIGRLVLRVVKGLPDQKVEDAINNGEMECSTFAPGEGIAGKVFQNMEPMIVNSTEQNDTYAERELSNVNSILCIPLIASDEAIGVINITNKIGGQGFSYEDLELLSALGNQAAVAINNATLYEMAITDELTKIFIRRYFNIKLDGEVKRVRRYGGQLSLAICDLDHFKSVNDTYGHQAGDVVLYTIAQLIKNNCREIDVAARYGGEEFAVIMPETGIDGAKILAERVRTAVAGTKIEEVPRQLTISIGIATFPDDADDVKSLIAAADAALYGAKNGGRNQVMVYSKEIVKPPEPGES
ncbi:MAG TPA: sensor domain-containing diguanylate cyclase [bacterium]|nr:sensor domain-containing diguanylate cyclase [bacterium]